MPGEPQAWGIAPEDVVKGRYRDDPAYLDAKARIDAQLLQRMERVFPGVGEHLVTTGGATPVTHTRYTHATGGTAYGLAPTPGQFLDGRPGPVGPVPGLYQCGASARAAHGIVGSLNGGWQAMRCIARDLGRTPPELQGWRRRRTVVPGVAGHSLPGR